MRIVLLAAAGILIGWLIIMVLRGKKEPMTRSASIGASVIRLVSYALIGAAVVFISTLAVQELLRH
ncbi:MAG: hypothetical protein VW778_02900 [Betaproteobacteria bacterium]|jgi:hypothetical protein